MEVLYHKSKNILKFLSVKEITSETNSISSSTKEQTSDTDSLSSFLEKSMQQINALYNTSPFIGSSESELNRETTYLELSIKKKSSFLERKVTRRSRKNQISRKVHFLNDGSRYGSDKTDISDEELKIMGSTSESEIISSCNSMVIDEDTLDRIEVLQEIKIDVGVKRSRIKSLCLSLKRRLYLD